MYPGYYRKRACTVADVELNAIQLDTLKEIGSIAAGKSAAGMGAMLGQRVSMTMPSVTVEDVGKIPGLFGGEENIAGVSSFVVDGQISGTVLAVFPFPQSIRLANTLTGAPSADNRRLDDMGESALKEFANIIAGSYLNAIAQITETRIRHSVPGFALDMVGAAMEGVLARMSTSAPCAVILQNEFTVGTDRDPLQLAFMPDLGSIEGMLHAADTHRTGELMQGHHRILIVDDENLNRVRVSDMIRTLGYEVETARDGSEAMRKIRDNIDLVLLDVVMPGMDGFEVTRRIRDDAATRDIPIIMVTGLESKTDRLRAVEAGANDFIAKPVDVTELRVRAASLLRMKRAQDALRQSELTFRTLVSNIPGAAYQGSCKNGKQTTRFLSNDIKSITGYSPEELAGNDSRAYTGIIHPEDRRIVAATILDCVNKRKPYTLEYRIVRVDGSVRWVHDRGQSVSTGSDAPRRLDGVVFDITERKEAEEKLKEAMATKSNFLSMVSHELRTPLTAITASLGIVADGSIGPVNDKQKRCLTIAELNLDRLTRLINDVLDLQKLDADRMNLHIKEDDINEAAREVHETFARVAEDKGLALTMRLADDLPRVNFDRDQIVRVLVNITDNAMKYTDQGSITLATARFDNVIRVSVTNTGAGIKEEDIPRLFERFEQLDSPKKRKQGGTGLGLAICKEIISQHKGKIWAESEVGEETTFHFILPIKERRADASE